MKRARYEEEDFNGFLTELIQGNRFNDSKEAGITERVIDKGFDSLSDKQKFVFEKAISHYVFDECSTCGNEIPWCEMSAAEDNGGQCSWCQHRDRKDD